MAPEYLLATLEGGSYTKNMTSTGGCSYSFVYYDDGCVWHPKHVEWTCRIINRLLCVASRWTNININCAFVSHSTKYCTILIEVWLQQRIGLGVRSVTNCRSATGIGQVAQRNAHNHNTAVNTRGSENITQAKWWRRLPTYLITYLLHGAESFLRS